MNKRSKAKDNSYKIRWKSAKEKEATIASINSVKGEMSINEWIKNLISKATNSNSNKNQISSVNDKLDQLLILSKNNNSLSNVTEVELRTLFWFLINKLDINLEKGFKQLDLNGKHKIPKDILEFMK